MARENQGWFWATCVCLAFSFSGCERPQLRSEREKAAEDEMEEAVATTSYEELRRRIIGQTFETLTLGSRKFTGAEVRDITDEAIVIAHSGGVDEIPWEEVTDEVREKWGYDPGARSLADRLSGMLPKEEEEPEPRAPAPVVEAKSPPDPQPEASLEQRLAELARKEDMLEAQLAGIRSLESDLARHSNTLAELRNRMAAIRASQSSQRSGGIRVERINGKSTMVDRAAEARELQPQIDVEEQLVAQFGKSLEEARREYRKLLQEVDRLRRK